MRVGREGRNKALYQREFLPPPQLQSFAAHLQYINEAMKYLRSNKRETIRGKR